MARETKELIKLELHESEMLVEKSNTVLHDHSYTCISKKTSPKRKIHEKDDSPHDDYYFSFNEKDIDTPQGPTPLIMEEINGRKFGRIHIPGDGDCFFHCLSMAN